MEIDLGKIIKLPQYGSPKHQSPMNKSLIFVLDLFIRRRSQPSNLESIVELHQSPSLKHQILIAFAHNITIWRHMTWKNPTRICLVTRQISRRVTKEPWPHLVSSRNSNESLASGPALLSALALWVSSQVLRQFSVIVLLMLGQVSTFSEAFYIDDSGTEANIATEILTFSYLRALIQGCCGDGWWP